MVTFKKETTVEIKGNFCLFILNLISNSRKLFVVFANKFVL